MGIRDELVLRAMAEIPRRLFVPEHLQGRADGDHPLPIGFGQTISQPFIVAWMTQALALTGDERVLEVGTGSGYQAAILSRLSKQVFTIELLPELADRARAILERLGIRNVTIRVGDGRDGWPEQAPFDAIVVTAAALSVPPSLVTQLRPMGRLIIPIGAAEDVQFIHELRKAEDGAVTDRELFAVRFVPLRGSEGGFAIEDSR